MISYIMFLEYHYIFLVLIFANSLCVEASNIRRYHFVVSQIFHLCFFPFVTKETATAM